MLVKNRVDLVSHGNRQEKERVLSMIEAGLAAVDPYAGTRRLVHIENGKLLIGGQTDMDLSGFGDEVIDLATVRDIYVVGAGKGIQRQAQALEEILGDRLTAGAITVKKGEGCYLKKVAVVEGGHPIPDEESILGARRIVEIARAAGEDDIVFTLFSSGASSLFALPTVGCSLEDIQTVYRLAIKYGSQSIIWRVMKYFSAVGGGRFTAYVHPARTVNLAQSVGKRFEPWHGALPSRGSWIPSWPPGPRRFAEAVEEMRIEPWWDELPQFMRAALERPDLGLDVPDIEACRQMRFSYWWPVHIRQMLEAAKRKAEGLGMQGVILGSFWGVSSVALAKIMVGIARDCARRSSPFAPPVAIISGGEMTNSVGQATGIGGRNQEFVLTMALELTQDADLPVIVGAIDSDGTDGPGWRISSGGRAEYPCLAGGIIDGETRRRIAERVADFAPQLKNHNSSPVLLDLGAGIYTGNTGACAGDLRVVVVTRPG